MEKFLGHQEQGEEEPAQPSLDLEKLPDEAKKLIQQLQERLTGLEQQNQALQRSEIYYQAMVENQLELVCRTLPDGNLIFVNEAYCRYFGKSREELLYSNFLDLIPSEAHASILCRRIEFTPDNPTIVAEHHVIDAQGQLRWNRWTTQAFFDAEGELLEFQSVGSDITEQKQAAERLWLLETVVPQLHESVMITDADMTVEPPFRIIYVNSAFTRITGYSAEEVIGQTPRLLQGPATDQSALEQLRQALAQKQPARVELINYRKDGTPFWLELSISPVINQNGHCNYFVAVQRDITRRKTAEQELQRHRDHLDELVRERTAELAQINEQLRQAITNQAALATHNARLYEALQASESRFRTISEMTSDYAYAIRVEPDQTVSLEWFTSAFTQLTGYTFEDIKGPLDNQIVHPEDLPLVQARMQRLLANQEDVTEYRIITTTGDIRWLRDYGRPVWDETENRVVRIINAAQDITERKQLEEQLYHAQKMDALGRLAGGVAHHFNNLLTAIIGFIELSMINLPDYHPAIEDLNQAHATSLRAAALTHQLIAFTRRQMVQARLFNLNDLVRRVETLLAQLIPVSVTFTTQLTPGTGSIKIDESQFEQLLTNLVINACEAMPEGGSLTIQTANVTVDPAEAVALNNLPPGSYARLMVSDTGVGISEELQSRIFEPFFTTKDVGQGAGLGLSTCYGIVKQHGGEIMVESRPGQGTTFHIYFPHFEEVT